MDRRRISEEPRLARLRLAAQGITEPGSQAPNRPAAAAVVSRMLALQAQDPAAARWAVGLRVGGSVTETDISEALASGAVLRTHLLRGTWQLVTPRDVRWLSELLAPRILARAARRFRELGLEPATLRRADEAIARALGEGHRTRAELSRALENAKIAVDGQRLSHLLWHAELSGLVTSGIPRAGRPTYASLDQRAPSINSLPDRETALAELARRYFESRGPATDADFAWWSGLSPAEARAARAAASAALTSLDIGGRVYWTAAEEPPARRQPSASAHLLPGFDEYLVAYRDRDAVLDPAEVARINAGGGMLNPVVIVDGQVRGVWRRELARGHVAIAIELFAAPAARVRTAIVAAAHRYAAFLALTAKIAVSATRAARPRRPLRA